jgi:hypothetical protein
MIVLKTVFVHTQVHLSLFTLNLRSILSAEHTHGSVTIMISQASACCHLCPFFFMGKIHICFVENFLAYNFIYSFLMKNKPFAVINKKVCKLCFGGNFSNMTAQHEFMELGSFDVFSDRIQNVMIFYAVFSKLR